MSYALRIDYGPGMSLCRDYKSYGKALAGLLAYVGDGELGPRGGSDDWYAKLEGRDEYVRVRIVKEGE